MKYISCALIINKNIPKYFLKLFMSKCIDKFAPIIAPNMPYSDIIIPSFTFMFLFFAFTIIAIIDVGIKKIKFVACAICCSILHKYVKRKMRMVPPPIPVPLTIPEMTPIIISNIFLSPFHVSRLFVALLFL